MRFRALLKSFWLTTATPQVASAITRRLSCDFRTYSFHCCGSTCSSMSPIPTSPRGLVGMGDIDEQVDPQQWNEYVRKSQDSLRVIAEATCGIAVVNQNDFSRALKRID